MTSHIEPSQVNLAAFVERRIEGEVVMLNLLRFRATADYSRSPDLAPDQPITGAEAYQCYAAHTTPFLEEAGGEVTFLGDGAGPLIGPADERWDLVILVRYPSTEAFLAMTTNPGYLAGAGHRTAALEDSRLFPLILADA